jgi:hemerythrin-like domain-containing protein
VSHDMKAMKDEQKAMLWVLVALRNITRRAAQTGSMPDFPKLRRLMNYVERLAERQHQAVEERYLFRPLETHRPALVRTMARLRRDHVAMKGYRLRLAEAVDYWQKGDPKSARHAPAVAQDYLDFCASHMRAERDLVPALRQAVSDAEWNDIANGFGAVIDPLARARGRRERETALDSFD